jgi:hypothetical protein
MDWNCSGFVDFYFNVAAIDQDHKGEKSERGFLADAQRTNDRKYTMGRLWVSAR